MFVLPIKMENVVPMVPSLPQKAYSLGGLSSKYTVHDDTA